MSRSKEGDLKNIYILGFINILYRCYIFKTGQIVLEIRMLTLTHNNRSTE